MTQSATQAYRDIHPPPEWLRTGGRGARVLMMDSGYNPTRHLSVAVSNFTRTRSDADRLNHGTRIAQVIGSQDPCEMGVAPEASLSMAKILPSLGRGISPIRRALDWALESAPDVLVMAFVCRQWDPTFNAALEDLDRHGTIICAAFNQWHPWPHSSPAVISVGWMGAVGTMDVQCHGRASLRGPQGIPEQFSGSSVSTAHLAGLAACGKAYVPGLTREGFLNGLRAANHASRRH